MQAKYKDRQETLKLLIKRLKSKQDEKERWKLKCISSYIIYRFGSFTHNGRGLCIAQRFLSGWISYACALGLVMDHFMARFNC